MSREGPVFAGAGEALSGRLNGVRSRANERTKLLPVMILTASKEEEDVVRSYALGANAHVRKPVDFGDLAVAAPTLGLLWLLFNQPPPSSQAP